MNITKINLECRICQKSEATEDYISIYDKIDKTNIAQIIIQISSIKILENDLLPKVICKQCLEKINLFNIFRELIIKTDECLKYTLYNRKTDSKDDNINSTSINYNETIENIRKPSVSTKKTYECIECNKIFRKYEHYKIHMTIHSGERKYACEHCPKRFARRYSLVYHTRIHTKLKPYCCAICFKTFRSPSNFHVHVKIHTNEKNHKCKDCDETFVQLESLNIHQRKVHTGERPFLCEKCSNKFRSKASLLTHQLDVHGQKYPCPHCHKLYSCRILKSHIKRHGEQRWSNKRFSCDQCGKLFTSSSSRKKHLLIHSGEKPFSCEICHKSFNQKSALKTHMKVHSDIKPFPCDFCSKTFKYKHHLKSHVTKNHSDVLLKSSC